MDYLEALDVRPQPFPKDTGLIATHLKRVQLEFESGVAVLGSPAAFDDHVEVTRLPDGRTHVEVEDHLRRVQGKR